MVPRLAIVTVSAVAVVMVLASTLIGVGDLTVAGVIDGGADDLRLLWASRIPRTVAVVLAGSSMAVAGLVMQALTRNRFVAPSTAGTLDAAALGLVVGAVVGPGWPIGARMVFAVAFALAGTAIFLVIIDRLRFQDAALVPLIGLMIGAVLNATSVFIAYDRGLLQALTTWTSGDFSGTLRGRYELLYIVAVLSLLCYLYAERFTVAGMGRDFAVNLGVDHGRTVLIGVALVATTSAVVVVVVGALPLLGLVVPNLVTALFGDRLKRVVPIVAAGGGLTLLAADIGSRTMRYPFEMPVGVVLNIVAGAVFLVLIVKARNRAT